MRIMTIKDGFVLCYRSLKGFGWLEPFRLDATVAPPSRRWIHGRDARATVTGKRERLEKGVVDPC